MDLPERGADTFMLTTIKAIHTLVWALFVSCIVAIWVFAWQADLPCAALMIGAVGVEIVVLILNGWRCPLTNAAARFTDDRRDNFDICLPEWLARLNKLIFGLLYLAGILFALERWIEASQQ